jgi:transcriptional regulator with GAF, ATPase, and Fis domain/tetratricopeptide (TPR) repeat protein
MTENDYSSLKSQIPTRVRSKLKKIDNQKYTNSLLDRLKELHLSDRLSTETLAGPFSQTVGHQDTARHETDLAFEATQRGSQGKGIHYLKLAVNRLLSFGKLPGNESAFITAALDVSSLCFLFGQRFTEMANLLESARDVAEKLGDQRHRVMINFHLGRLLYSSNRRHEGFNLLRLGKDQVEELGDRDILDQSAEFLGLYYFMQGLFAEAIVHFERAIQVADEYGGKIITPLAPILLPYCEAYSGQFHRAVGNLDCFWHMAKRRGDYSLAVFVRASLGVILLLINKQPEALHHLNAALEESLAQKHALALYVARGGLDYYHFLKGDLTKAYELMLLNFAEGADNFIDRHYSSPWVLEMIFEFDRKGFFQDGHFTLRQEFDRIMNEPNIHLQGVALRLRAKALLSDGRNETEALKNLLASENYLTRCGDPLQLAKTRIDLALLKLRQRKTEESRLLAYQARQGLSGTWEELFPDGLRFLLESNVTTAKPQDTYDAILDRFIKSFIEISSELVPNPSLDNIMNQFVSAMNRLFMSERAGLFWQERGGIQGLVLKAARNLTQEDVEAEDFRSNLALVVKAYRTNQPLLVQPNRADNGHGNKSVLAILCLPLEVDGSVRGVLYLDNSYIDHCFNFAQGPRLSELMHYLATYTQKIWEYGRIMKEAEHSARQKQLSVGISKSQEILYEIDGMASTMFQAEQVARSEASILILGETGVGKEILARWIYQVSHRNQGPFVIVDPMTIPESLIESELFGHEKGAFTGADRQKIGILELADKGTLFIDEVGEIPMQVQTRFLRVLQEKTFVRLGGTRPISSDFRLLTATNRDLLQEVGKGRFREDLFYRIDVVELKIPPLRDRPKDVILLAKHFLSLFARKHNRPEIFLLPEDEERLVNYRWPGNIRELKNMMERAVLLSPDGRFKLDLPSQSKSSLPDLLADNPSLDELQRRYIFQVLEKTKNKIGGPSGAAELLGINRNTLYSRMKKLGLR